MKEEYINLKEYISESYLKDNSIFKRDKVAFFFPIWYYEDVVKQAEELGYKYETDYRRFDILSGVPDLFEITIEVGSINN